MDDGNGMAMTLVEDGHHGPALCSCTQPTTVQASYQPRPLREEIVSFRFFWSLFATAHAMSDVRVCAV